jgi:hypothetical protein
MGLQLPNWAVADEITRMTRLTQTIHSIIDLDDIDAQTYTSLMRGAILEYASDFNEESIQLTHDLLAAVNDAQRVSELIRNRILTLRGHPF